MPCPQYGTLDGIGKPGVTAGQNLGDSDRVGDGINGRFWPWGFFWAWSLRKLRDAKRKRLRRVNVIAISRTYCGYAHKTVESLTRFSRTPMERRLISEVRRVSFVAPFHGGKYGCPKNRSSAGTGAP